MRSSLSLIGIAARSTGLLSVFSCLKDGWRMPNGSQSVKEEGTLCNCCVVDKRACHEFCHAVSLADD